MALIQPKPKVEVIDKLLQKTGIDDRPAVPAGNLSRKETARVILEQQGASLENVLGNMAQLQYSENEMVRLKVVENMLNIHGVSLKEEEKKANNSVVIVINDKDPDAHQRVDSILCPVREVED